MYIFEVDNDIYASLSPQPDPISKHGGSGKALDDVGEGNMSHIEQLFDRQTAASSVAVQRLAAALDVMYGRISVPDKVRANANKKLLKAVSGLTSESTELRIWDEGFQATPDLSGFPNTTVLDIGHNPMTVLDGLSAVPKLEKLDISNCPDLVVISDEIGKLTELRELNLSMCYNLQTLPESLRGHPKLEVLDLDECSVVLDIEMLASFPSLKEVRLPTGFSEDLLVNNITRRHVAPASIDAMVELADRLRIMRPDIKVLQSEKHSYTLHAHL